MRAGSYRRILALAIACLALTPASSSAKSHKAASEGASRDLVLEPFKSREKEPKFQTSSVVVNANIEVVWEAIQRSRQSERRKLVSYDGNAAVVEEKFHSLPVIGNAEAVYREAETHPQRIDYELISSNHFRVFEGKWELESVANDKTLVRLTSHIDPIMWVPFKDQLTSGVTLRDINRRLTDIKTYSEGVKRTRTAAL